MRIINLDQFKTVDLVSLGGKQYEVYGRPVEDYLNSDVEAQMDACETVKEKFELIVGVVQKYSNIPKTALVKQTMGVLNALLKIINGIDVEAEMKTQAEKDDQGN